MNAQSTPLTPAYDADALRAAFRAGDAKVRQALVPTLRPEEVTFAGVRMFVDPRDNYTERRIWLDGQPPEMESLLSLVELVEDKCALVLDVGANCGAYTVPLARAARAGSKVLAFEPNPVMVSRLQHNIVLNDVEGVVDIQTCALGAETGTATLNFKRGNFGQASLMPIRARQHAGETQVEVRSLLDFVDANARYDISVLKIDVEGAEELALAPLLTAKTWLPDVLLMETRHADEWDGDLLGQIKAAGFTVARKVEGNTLFVRGNAA
jgi:FkbM family methyltransferase